MAATPAAVTLTERHRLAQLRLGVVTAALLEKVWPLLDPENLDATFDRWLTAVQPIVRTQRATSSKLASGYLTAFRQLELGTADQYFRPELAEPVAADQLATSLLVTGPVSLRAALGRNRGLAAAVDQALANSTAAAVRHTLNGGRDTIGNTVDADRRALGYARVTSGNACAFCSMLASRGPVYKSKTTAGDGRKYHDHCHCTVEPVYREDAAWPPGAERLRDLWDETTGGLSGKSAYNAFRRALAER